MFVTENLQDANTTVFSLEKTPLSEFLHRAFFLQNFWRGGVLSSERDGWRQMVLWNKQYPKFSTRICSETLVGTIPCHSQHKLRTNKYRDLFRPIIWLHSCRITKQNDNLFLNQETEWVLVSCGCFQSLAIKKEVNIK